MSDRKNPDDKPVSSECHLGGSPHKTRRDMCAECFAWEKAYCGEGDGFGEILEVMRRS